MSMHNVGYKFRCYPSNKQKKALAKNFGCARFVYNHCLRMRNLAYKRRQEKLNYISLSKHITKLKKTRRYHWLSEAAADALVQSLLDLEKSFINYFKKIAKYPRYKKKYHTQQIRYQLDQRIVKNNYLAGKLLKLTKLGAIKTAWSKIPHGTPKMVTIIKTAANKYYLSFSCMEELKVKPKVNKEIGVDVGIKDVVVTSDAYYSGSPKYFYKYARQLKLAQRALSRKTKGSKRYEQQRIMVARIHEKIANCRHDFSHKETSKLIANYDVIYLEDLNINGMLKNRKLSKAVADIGLYELKRQLIYKADWYGREITIIDRFEPTTSKCSNCHTRQEMSLKDRIFECRECGLILNRDLNAAINIKRAGLVLRRAVNQLEVSQTLV